MIDTNTATDTTPTVTGTVRLCPHACSKFRDVTPSGYEMELVASPPDPDQPFGELVAGLMKAGQGQILSAGKARLKENNRPNCVGTLKWKRTDCSKITISYKVPTDCNWYRTVIHPVRPPFGDAHHAPDWEWRLETRYPDGKVVYPGQTDDSRWPRGEKLEYTLTTLQMVPGCLIQAEEYYYDPSGNPRTASQVVRFGTPTLTGGYIRDVVDEDKRLYKVVVFGEEHTVLAGDWRKWASHASSETFVILGPNCFSDESGHPRPCPHTDDICSERGDFNTYGPRDILEEEDYVIVPISIQGVNPVGPPIREYGPRDWAALLDAQVVAAVVEDRNLENDTADISY